MSKQVVYNLPNASGGASITATGAGSALQIEHTGLVGFYLNGTGTSPSIKLQQSADNTNWVDVPGAVLTAPGTSWVGNVAAKFIRQNTTAGTTLALSAQIVMGGPHNA